MNNEQIVVVITDPGGEARIYGFFRTHNTALGFKLTVDMWIKRQRADLQPHYSAEVRVIESPTVWRNAHTNTNV